MAGIYLHIPFCRKACSYCDFHFVTNLNRKTSLLQAIHQEIALTADFFPPQTEIHTIYFGGGTPSVMQAEEITQLINTLNQHYSISPTAEITLEANPEDLNAPYLQALAQTNVNRLSIGIQSLYEDELNWMNRNHTAQQSLQVIEQAQTFGFHNLNIDLIFGTPNLTQKRWQSSLDHILALDIPHLSLYSLTVEPKTALHHQVAKGIMRIPADTLYNEQFLFAHDYLTRAGFEHYEISNYSLPGAHSRHNRAYWEGIPYLGLGPSAHSYRLPNRRWNVANNAAYIKSIQAGQLPIETEEELDLTAQYNEYLLTALRTHQGIHTAYMHATFQRDITQTHNPFIQAQITQGNLRKTAHGYALTPQGWLIADRIISDFFED